MTLVKYQNPVPTFFDRFFDNDLGFFGKRDFSPVNATLPSVNIKESDEEFTVEVAAPGFEKDDFNIEIDNNVLTINSEKEEENETKEGERFSRREFSYHSFTRSFTLPETVNVDKVSAEYVNGILKLHIPKKDEAKPKPIKQISIK